MPANHKKGTSKYEFLLALGLGESEVFDNLPTATEGRRKVPPSQRRSYIRMASAVSKILPMIHPGYKFTISAFTSEGSRIEGDKVRITLVAIGDQHTGDDNWREHERRRQNMLEAWKRRKQAEDAPKLPAQLEEARQQEEAKRAERAKARVIYTPPPVQYDPVRLAELVLAHAQGKQIQALAGDKWVNDGNPTWKLPTAHYRVKPVRREFYLIVGRNGDVTAAADAVDKLPHHDPACLVHAVEVREEDT